MAKPIRNPASQPFDATDEALIQLFPPRQHDSITSRREKSTADHGHEIPTTPASPSTAKERIEKYKRKMFGPFRITNPLSGGLLWKIPWRLSRFQKRRHRLRLRAVDNVVATLGAALAKKGQTLEALERWKAEMPTEAEMLPKDKYTMFDRKAKKYRKGIHSEHPPSPDYRLLLFMYFSCSGCFQSWRVCAVLFCRPGICADDVATQSCPSGRECHNESTLLVIKQGTFSRSLDSFSFFSFFLSATDGISVIRATAAYIPKRCCTTLWGAHNLGNG